LAAGILADLGATVTVVERPGTGDPARAIPAVFHARGRNKRYLSVDLKSAEGREVVRRLIDGSDVVISAYRPRVARNLGLDPESLRRDHPRLIIVSLSAYGPESAQADKPAHDLSLQASAGMLAGAPPRRGKELDGAPVVDMATGLYAAIAALAALHARAVGAPVGTSSVSMQDSAYALNMFALTRVLGGMPRQADLRAPAGYGMFTTRDGRIAALSVSVEPHHWSALCRLMGRDDWAALGLSERVEGRERLNHVIAEFVVAEDSADLEERLSRAGLPFEWVLTGEEVVRSDEFRTGGASDGFHLASPIVVDGTRLPVRNAAPAVGADAFAVLSELGYTAREVDGLAERAVVTIEPRPER
jgi:crotonobetainyl-CoA:carnitine CoA-transferase CaiB-like acyl-CoA transferase